MTESNSVELFNVEFFLTGKLTLKVEIPLFWGFVHPSDFPKSGGDPVYGGGAKEIEGTGPDPFQTLVSPNYYPESIFKNQWCNFQ